MRKLIICLIVVSVLCFTQFGLADSNDGLIAYWPFNGNANDESGNANDGTVYGAALTIDRFGNPGAAYSFDGVDDVIEIGKQVLFSTNFSVMIWVKSAGAQNTYSCPISQGHGYVNGYKGWAFQYGYPNPPDFKFITTIDGQSWLTVDFDLDLEIDLNWHFFAVVKDGSILKTYKDGALEDAVILNNEIILGSFNLRIGADTYNPGRFFSGSLDDIRIFNRALTESELFEIYNESPCSYGPPNQPLTYVRSKGKPSSEVVQWESCGGAGAMAITIGSISSAYIELNDEIILTPECLTNCTKQKIDCIIFNVDLLKGQNVLEAEIHGKPGSSITIEFKPGN